MTKHHDQSLHQAQTSNPAPEQLSDSAPDHAPTADRERTRKPIRWGRGKPKPVREYKPKLTWERKEDEVWAASLEVRLVLDHDAPAGLADQVLTEVHEIVREEGRPALELFGASEAYTQVVADERITEEHRARVDAHGMTPGERLSAAFVSFGVAGFFFCALEWLRGGLWVGISWPAVTLTVMIVLAVALSSLAVVARAAGLVRGALWFAAATVATVCAGIGATAAVPDGQLFTVPAPVLMLACLAGIAAAVRFPDATIDRWFAKNPTDSDDDAWFARLDGLLRGRHAMSAAQADGHVREARHHLASAPGEAGAVDVFGDVEVYALRLAEGPSRTRRFARRQFYGSCVLTVSLTILLIDNLTNSDSSPFWLAANTGALGAALWSLVTEWRRSTAPDTHTHH
ncbi:hypothetical protein [Streptomyces silvensis]|uniref:Uncharacterized protein n=1 Tax=Streptomyces silvensis TaxID=1765722 RepID=A0A0W7XAX8_9ACTN|nr:hypothetical protein [Streptomyces silvensis]KUF19796.1 hypothetical protein AT728_05490 [Streptomyces silvensis]